MLQLIQVQFPAISLAAPELQAVYTELCSESFCNRFPFKKPFLMMAFVGFCIDSDSELGKAATVVLGAFAVVWRVLLFRKPRLIVCK